MHSVRLATQQHLETDKYARHRGAPPLRGWVPVMGDTASEGQPDQTVQPLSPLPGFGVRFSGEW